VPCKRWKKLTGSLAQVAALPIQHAEGRIALWIRMSDEIEAVADHDPPCERLMTVPGIGRIISSAMVAAISNGAVFTKGRDFGAWLGLVPRDSRHGPIFSVHRCAVVEDRPPRTQFRSRLRLSDDLMMVSILASRFSCGRSRRWLDWCDSSYPLSWCLGPLGGPKAYS
jgi:hypothetical protein